MLQVLSWLETACYERFFGKETACYRYCWRKNCHVVKRFADKKQHIRATFCEERAWWIEAICTEDTECWDTIQGRDDTLMTCDKDVAIWTSCCRRANINWMIRQPGDSMVKSCYGRLERSMLIYFAGNKCAYDVFNAWGGSKEPSKAYFLLGRNTCWRGFARKSHVPLGYYEEKWQVKGRFAEEMA